MAKQGIEHGALVIHFGLMTNDPSGSPVARGGFPHEQLAHQ
ncbi:MAG: hypothetical protein RMY28_023155 [Nostoc sp. ChiSLP01]|nr:hypothetical protein [Nostoc sp. ChiSLP01]